MRSDLKMLKRHCSRLNIPMFISMLVLLVTGVFFIYSACFIGEDVLTKPLYFRQILWIVVGLCVFAFFSIVDYRRLCQIAWWLFGGSCFLLVLLMIHPKKFE